MTKYSVNLATGEVLEMDGGVDETSVAGKEAAKSEYVREEDLYRRVAELLADVLTRLGEIEAHALAKSRRSPKNRGDA